MAAATLTLSFVGQAHRLPSPNSNRRGCPTIVQPIRGRRFLQRLLPRAHVFRRVVIDLCRRSNGGRFLDIVSCVTRHLLCLRVVNHHRLFRFRRRLLPFLRVHRDVTHLLLFHGCLALLRHSRVSPARPHLSHPPLALRRFIPRDEINRHRDHRGGDGSVGGATVGKR